MTRNVFCNAASDSHTRDLQALGKLYLAPPLLSLFKLRLAEAALKSFVNACILQPLKAAYECVLPTLLQFHRWPLQLTSLCCHSLLAVGRLQPNPSASKLSRSAGLGPGVRGLQIPCPTIHAARPKVESQSGCANSMVTPTLAGWTASSLTHVPSFVPSFLRSFVPSFLRSFVPSFLRSFVPSFLGFIAVALAYLPAASKKCASSYAFHMRKPMKSTRKFVPFLTLGQESACREYLHSQTPPAALTLKRPWHGCCLAALCCRPPTSAEHLFRACSSENDTRFGEYFMVCLALAGPPYPPPSVAAQNWMREAYWSHLGFTPCIQWQQFKVSNCIDKEGPQWPR